MVRIFAVRGLLSFRNEKVLIIALTGQVILTVYQRRSGTYHFYHERPP